MAERRRGLGRGLGALIPSAPAPAPEETAPLDPAPPVSEARPDTSAPAAVAAPRASAETTEGADAPRSEPAGAPAAQQAQDPTTRAKTKTGKKAAGSRSGATKKSADAGKIRGAQGTDAAGTVGGSGTTGAARKSSPAGTRRTTTEDTSPVSSEAVASTSKDAPQAQTFDLEGLSGDDRPVDAPAGSPIGEEVTPQETRPQKTDDVSRETPAARRRTITPEARQKAMRSRLDMSAALRSRTGVDRPSDMFFSPSSASIESADTPDEAADPAELDAQDHPATDDAVAVSRETATAPAPTPAPAEEAESVTPTAVPTVSEPVAAAASPETAGGDAAEATQELAAVPGAVFAEVSVDDIHPNRKQPREVFDEDELAELAYSIGELGVLQPIVVRPSREAGGPRHELVMGERRWRATQRAGLPTIPAIVRETADDDLLRDALLENLHRSQLNPLEEAAAYQQLLEEFGATQEELSRRIGRSRPQISNTLRLMKLPPLVQRRVAAGVLSAGHARALLALEDPAEMERLAQRIVAEGMSVRAAEEAASLSKRTTTTRRAGAQAQERHRERLDYIAEAFADKLDTSVKINLGARKGRMTIEFASVEDLNRIITVLDPQAENPSDD